MHKTSHCKKKITLYGDKRVNSILNMYAPNNKVLKHMQGKLIGLNTEIHKCTIILGDLTVIKRKSRQLVRT